MVSTMKQELSAYKKNIVSQFGEDGILEEVFHRIGPQEGGLAVEVGSWDGKYCSNTWNLWHNKGWRAILIEGNRERHEAFIRENDDCANVVPVCAFVETSGKNSLDQLLSKVIPNEPQIDLLSIDIDGDDYYIWQSLSIYKPRVVVIEYNPTIPPHLSLVQEPGQYFGASAKMLVELGLEKGYELIAMTETNCIFIVSGLISDAGVSPLSIQKALPPDIFSYVMSAYDGTTILTKMPMFSAIDRPLQMARIPHFTGNTYPFIPVHIRRLSSPFRMFLRAGKRKVKKIMKTVGLLEVFHRTREYIRAYKRTQQHRGKQHVVRQYQKQFGIKKFIETGTYQGDMVSAMQTTFRDIHSIELGDELYTTAKMRFSAFPHIHLHHGDSARILPEILPTLQEPILFWLDAHYSLGDTARGPTETPIEKELLHILSHGDAHVILIDDARCFDGTHDYPTLEQLRDSVETINPKYTLEVAQDIIRVTPKEHSS